MTAFLGVFLNVNEKFFDLKSEKQDRMINAALKVFAVNGYKHASTDEIVKEAGISKGLLFHYFVSKIGLYSFLLDYSVKYMNFEYSRTITDADDYFEYLEKLEMAKLNVLKTYPYMNEFIAFALKDEVKDLDNSGKEALVTYTELMERYKSKAGTPKLKSGIDQDILENMINYTIKGLSDSCMNGKNFKPEEMNSKIVEYIRTFKKMAE